jgi:hypothetical protein
VARKVDSTTEARAWLIGAAASNLNSLAAIAAHDPELDDLRDTFVKTADAFARRIPTIPHLRVLSSTTEGLG